jgi:hypothetical protein
MSWNPPRAIWQWLLLVSPAVEILLMSLVADRWGMVLFPDHEIHELTFLFNNLFVALALSLVLGLWLAGTFRRWPDRIGIGLVYGVCLAFLNGLIAFAGCAAGKGVF